MGLFVSGHIFDGTLPFSSKKFKNKIWRVQLLENAPQVEAKSYRTTVTYKEFCNYKTKHYRQMNQVMNMENQPISNLTIMLVVSC